MTQRLVWNFEFTPTTNFVLSDLENQKEDDLKWEARFFWPEAQIIKLYLLEPSLLDLATYQHKQKKDLYYLIPGQNYNIKNRRDELVYKPLVKQGKYSLGFGAKINLNDSNKALPDKDALKLNLSDTVQLLKHSDEVIVKKDSLIYKFPTHPNIKLELARIEINSLIYFSLCIEGKSRELVETLSKQLLGKQPTDNYVGFLKNIIKKS